MKRTKHNYVFKLDGEKQQWKNVVAKQKVWNKMPSDKMGISKLMEVQVADKGYRKQKPTKT